MSIMANIQYEKSELIIDYNLSTILSELKPVGWHSTKKNVEAIVVSSGDGKLAMILRLFWSLIQLHISLLTPSGML